jgi:hypothetical protein
VIVLLREVLELSAFGLVWKAKEISLLDSIGALLRGQPAFSYTRPVLYRV